MADKAPTLFAIDETTSTPDPTSLFADRTGFFRVADADKAIDLDAFRVDDGPIWDSEEANARTRYFFAGLAGGRTVVEHADAFDFVIANELLLLIGDREQRAFEQLYRRMDDATVTRWQELLDGGRASEAFGPLSLEEQLDETKLAQEMDRQRRVRGVSLAGMLVVLVAVVGGVLWVMDRGAEESVVESFSFEDPTAADRGGAVGSPRPDISGAVVASIETAIVVKSGDGVPAERVQPVPDRSLFDARFDGLHMVLLAEAGEGRVAVLGDTGWFDELCVVASSLSEQLRPLSTTHLDLNEQACGVNPVGAAAAPVCVGPDVVMLPVDIPASVVELDEGGQARVDSVRVRIISPAEGYEQVSLRGAVDLSVEGAAVIPAFAWSTSGDIELDVPVSGTRRVKATCTRVEG